MNPAELYTQLATQAPKRETPVVEPEDNFVLPELTEAEEKELGDYIQQAYSMYEGLPPAQKFVAEVAPGTGEAISAYETKKFFKETKDAIKEGKFGEAALKGGLTALAGLGTIPLAGKGIQVAKAAAKRLPELTSIENIKKILKQNNKPATEMNMNKIADEIGESKEYINPNFVPKGQEPKDVIKGYKVFQKKDDGNIYPLYVDSNTPVPINQWMKADKGFYFLDNKGKKQQPTTSGSMDYKPIKNAEETLTLYRDETNPKTKEKKADGTLDAAIEDLEQTIEEQKRIKALEKGKESGIDATEALAIETAQKAYDDTLKEYNEGVDQVAELAKAKEELEELKLASRSETFSPTNAYASETPIIVGSYINKVGSAVVLNSQLYNISSIGIEVVFQVDASDQETVTLGDNVEIELPTDERVPTVITFIDQVVTQTQTGDFIEVILEVLNPEEIEAYDQAPVKVFVTTEISQNVLYVPVNALIALAEGGYALEIYDGEIEGSTFEGESGVDTIYVAVEIGVFTDGFVEVIGNIAKGQLVVVPR